MDEDYIFNRYIENTNEYERALSALLNPDGRRLSEIADSKHTQVSKEILQKITKYFVEDNLLLLESDGKKSDPRIYRNDIMYIFQMMWRIHVTYGPNSLHERLDELNEEIDAYKNKTGYDEPQELLNAIKNEDEDLSHIETDGTGEIFWDVYSPWCNTKNQVYLTKLTIKLSDDIQENIKHIPMDVSGIYGDFSDNNKIDKKLGLNNE